ncbi:hypothetical protein SLEP1_g28226 [Rubroshorea leprosula]|uniref:Uncharacterized protein n=1 Tax=Rubroshorea leprosula TaxID=152421 RepID=A0AAV5K038_9ROSI|nr:hypothetical protein SLEP1_g28226 [Rubroshorea leprosula]
MSTPRIHLGALQVNPECRYGLKRDFWSARGGNSSQPLGRGQVPSNLSPHPPPPIPNTFPHVDHAEGEDENQPHNSVHNSASTANQGVVATQLAAMQQQFGVFQLVLAQLLAWNNPGDPLINLLNPAPQPPAPPQILNQFNMLRPLVNLRANLTLRQFSNPFMVMSLDVSIA